MAVDISKLKGVVPDEVWDQLNTVQTHFNINTTLRLTHFLSQLSHESDKFRFKVENLNYRADQLYSMFRKYFPTMELALKYEKLPERIGNRIYANRMGNGSEFSGDGFKYRGRGFIQITGKDNYIEFGKFLFKLGSAENVVIYPTLVTDKYPLLSSVWFWKINDLNTIADLGSDVETITKMTKRINGGKNGLENRIKEFNKFYKLFITGS